MNWLQYWHWFALGLVLIIAESLGASGFLIAIGMSAIFTGALTLMVQMIWQTQLIVFSVLCIVFAYTWWHTLKRQPAHSLSLINRPLEAMVGLTTVLVDGIENGRGKIHINDAHWYVTGPELSVGTKVKIIGVQDQSILIVEQAL